MNKNKPYNTPLSQHNSKMWIVQRIVYSVYCILISYMEELYIYRGQDRARTEGQSSDESGVHECQCLTDVRGTKSDLWLASKNTKDDSLYCYPNAE